MFAALWKRLRPLSTAPCRRNIPPRLEQLEDRSVPAVITVTSLADDEVRDGLVTLREAVHAANADISVDGSAPGSGADQIVFSPKLAGGVSLSHIAGWDHGPSALLITSALTITGSPQNGMTLRTDSNDPLRLF